MSRVVISKKGSLIFYIENYKNGSSGYMIDYTKGDLSRNISCQCKIKVVEYMVFGTNENSKKYFINLKHKYPYKTYKSFVIHNSEIDIVVCVKRISDWEFDILTEDEIRSLILFGDLKFKTNKFKNEMITFNTEWMKRGVSK